MAASLPTGVLPAHPGELTTSEKPKLTSLSTEKEPSEAAELGGSREFDHSRTSQLPRDTISKSRQELSPDLHFNPQDRVGLCDQLSPRRGLGSDLDVVHPESACDDSDVCERSTSEGRRVLKLEKDVKRLEEVLREKDQIIATLCEENSRKTAELLEIQLQKVCQKAS